MKPSSTLVTALLGALALPLAACTDPQLRPARDAGHEPVDEQPRSDAGAMDGSTAGEGDAALPGPDGGDAPDASPDADEDAQVPSPTDGGQDAGDDAGGDAGGDAGEDEDAACDGGLDCACARCVCDPEPLGSVSGDTDGPVLERDGAGEAGFEILVTEDDHAFLAPRDLTMEATLTSTGGSFELGLHEQGVSAGCYALTERSRGEGPRSVSVRWVDDQGISGGDSSRVVAIGIEPLSSGGSWHLVVRGNVSVAR